MQAIILAGGFGTRLKSVIADLPKPMAPIAQKPFLACLVDYLHKQGITEIIFSMHYLGEKIASYFQTHYPSANIGYVFEDQPLGTGGAIVHVINSLQLQKPVFVLNGDTFLQMNYATMWEQFTEKNAELMLALREVSDCARYGKVSTEQGRIVDFQEKNAVGSGFINAGVYLLSPTMLLRYKLPQAFSFEKDFLYPYTSTLKPHAFLTPHYFIDIGIPEEYLRAQQELPKLI